MLALLCVSNGAQQALQRLINYKYGKYLLSVANLTYAARPNRQEGGTIVPHPLVCKPCLCALWPSYGDQLSRSTTRPETSPCFKRSITLLIALSG
jgi:hypothetical protein